MLGGQPRSQDKTSSKNEAAGEQVPGTANIIAFGEQVNEDGESAQDIEIAEEDGLSHQDSHTLTEKSLDASLLVP